MELCLPEGLSPLCICLAQLTCKVFQCSTDSLAEGLGKGTTIVEGL